MENLKSSIYKRNYLLLVLEGSFFMGGTGFLNASTVIPVFINMITGNKQLVGLTLTIASFLMYFSRLIVGPFMSHIKNNARFAAVCMLICRPQTLMISLFVFTGHLHAAVYVLMASYALLWGFDGIIFPPWSEVLANTVDENRHGRLLGTQILLGGFAAIGAGVLINIFLNSPGINLRTSFGMIFLLGGILFAISCAMMLMVEKYPQNAKKGKIDFKGYYRDLPRYFISEKDNTWQLFVQFVLTVASMSTPFIILFAGDRAGLSTAVTAVLILTQTLGTPVGGWLWGQICDRFGCETGMKLAGITIFAVSALPLLVLFFPRAALAILVPSIFLAGVNGGFGNCSYVYTVQAVRPESRSACLVLSSFIALPATFSSYLAGFISENLGYTVLFAVCVSLALLGFAMALRIKPIKDVIARRTEIDDAKAAQPKDMPAV